MRKKAAFTPVILSIILFSSATATLSQSADYNKVGVKVGDTAEYSVSVSSTDEVSMVINITNVSAPTVEINVTFYFSTHPTQNETFIYDVSTGTGFIPILTAPGLSVGDPIYLGSSGMINDTIAMTVAGTSRSVNHFNYSAPSFSYGEYYWDKNTGLLVKSSFGNPNFSENISLTSTTSFNAAFPSVLVLLVAAGFVGTVLLIVLVIGVVLPRRRSSNTAA
jgi:hypothetical protein